MKVLVSDFDFTFYPDNYVDNIKEANRFVALGNVFIIATGRSAKSLVDRIKTYNINYSYLICNDGAVIYDKNHQLIRNIKIDIETALKVSDYLKLYYDEVYFDNGYELVFDSKDNISGIVARFNDINDAKNILRTIEQEFKDVHGYLSDNYINITHIDATKASAIKYLELLNNYKQIFVTGDKVNDISMFQNYYGISIANSIEELKELAHEHVDDFIDVINVLKRR